MSTRIIDVEYVSTSHVLNRIGFFPIKRTPDIHDTGHDLHESNLNPLVFDAFAEKFFSQEKCVHLKTVHVSGAERVQIEPRVSIQLFCV